jgi:DNA polymerase V
MYALVDCNNFYVSCERVFDPSLNGKPVIVLSNNDGCAISRSDEAKEAGIEMGAIPHLIPHIIRERGIRMFSSNYTLYGDMSDRVMKTLSGFVPRMEIYSIDEAFLDMSSMPYADLLSLGLEVRSTVYRNTGIPTCVGIAPTKALAKMANRFAKKKNKKVGVHWAANDELIKEMLEYTSVGDVWGIGREYALMLLRNGIRTAFDFSQAPEDFVRKHMSVVGLRLRNELKGIPTIPWDDEPVAKKNICCARSFGALTSDKALIREAISNFAANCGSKLRRQQSVAKSIKVFINTNPHLTTEKQYYRSVIIQLDTATSSTPELIKYALKGLDIIFKEGHRFMKCGVELLNLIPENEIQLNIFEAPVSQKITKATAALDKVNGEMGKDLVRYGVQGFSRKYKARAAHLSPCYTTNINHIIKVR